VDALPAEARSAAVHTLARAFRDNPLNLAVIGRSSEQRERANLHGMRMTLRAASGQGLLLRGCEPDAAADAVHGALIAIPPGSHPLPPAPLLDQLRCTLGQGWRVMRRWGEVHEVLREAHPVLPHWYVFVVGVDPERQGRGIGRAMLDTLLERIDASSEPAYLETDREENVDFYGRAGFRVADAREIFGTPIWTLWRKPGTSRDNGLGRR
jgi:ribosomal protein S18 acetylase RimI-like enzyme